MKCHIAITRGLSGIIPCGTQSLSMPLEIERYREWESFFPPWSLWSSPAISLIDAYEDLFPECCRGNSVMFHGMWDIPHRSLQCMGHCSLQIAHCVMPGPLPCLKAVIKLFPPLQEAVLCVTLALLVANIWRNQKSLDIDSHGSLMMALLVTFSFLIAE